MIILLVFGSILLGFLLGVKKDEFVSGIKLETMNIITFIKKQAIYLIPAAYILVLIFAISGQNDIQEAKQFKIIQVLDKSTAIVQDIKGNKKIRVIFEDREVFDNQHDWTGFFVEVTEGKWLNKERTVLLSRFDIWG